MLPSIGAKDAEIELPTFHLSFSPIPDTLEYVIPGGTAGFSHP